ncbi:MAG TPA: hypothetical protein VFF79_19285 [Conexibacter sp.]|nr:hypothetical protein [Conexibacter sp.]
MEAVELGEQVAPSLWLGAGLLAGGRLDRVDDHAAQVAVGSEVAQPLHELALEWLGRHDRLASDAMKNSICMRLGLPLLRLGARVARQRGPRESIVAWLVEVWFAHRGFLAGGAPADEPFIPFSVIGRDSNNRVVSPLALDGDARARCQQYHRLRRLRYGAAQRRVHFTDDGIEIYAVLALAGERWVAGHATVDHLEWHGAHVDRGFLSLLLADGLALTDAIERLERHLAARDPRTDSLAMSANQYAALKGRTADWQVFGVVGNGKWQSLVRMSASSAIEDEAAWRARVVKIAHVMAMRDAIEDVTGVTFPELFSDVLDS